MKQYVKHEAKWDANNPVAIFSRDRLNRGCLKISAAICIGGAKLMRAIYSNRIIYLPIR